MEAISQREMRNNSAQVLRRVASGESFVVTNNGVPAAVLSPAPTDRRGELIAAGLLRPGTGLNLDELPEPLMSTLSTAELLDEDRG
jgi:prevent-host-death family protein